MSTRPFPEKQAYDISDTTRIKLIREIIAFLQRFMPPILARRLMSVILLIAGIPHELVSEWTGSCDRSVRQWRKQIASGDTDGLLKIETGAGRKSKFADIEQQVLEEINKGNYHTQQQIVDMVKEKFNVDVSLMAVSRLLKKTESGS
jgi:transposase